MTPQPPWQPTAPPAGSAAAVVDVLRATGDPKALSGVAASAPSGDYPTQVLATDGLVAFYKLDEASGNALDSGPLGLHLTPSGSGLTRQSEQLCQGIAASATADGVAGQFSRAVSAATDPMHLPDAVTVCGWVKAVVWPTNGGAFAGQQNEYGIKIGSTSQANAFVTTTVTVPVGAGATPLATGWVAGEILFVAMTWSRRSGRCIIWVNGIPLHAATREGSINFSSANFQIFANGSTFANLEAAGVAVFNRELGGSKLRAFYDAGRLGASSIQSPNLFNPSGGTLHGSGLAPTKLSPTEQRITTQVGHIFAPDAYAAAAMRNPAGSLVGATAATVADRLPDETCKLIEEWTTLVTQSADPTRDKNCHDGTKFVWGSSSVTFNRSTAQMCLGLAALYRHQAMTPYKDRAWVLNLCKTHMEYLLSQQKPSGDANAGAVLYDESTNNTYFAGRAMAVTTLILRKDLDAATLGRWTAACVAAGNWVYGDNNAFYINGNFELQSSVLYYALWLLTGDTLWQTRFNTQFAKAIAPGAVQNNSGVDNTNAGASGFGLKDGGGNALGLAGLYATGLVNGKAYLAESNNPGTVGLDWDYLMLQGVFAAQLYNLSGDPLHLKLLSVLTNKAMERFQTLAAPTFNTATPSASGGVLATATYYYVVTAKFGSGETTKSAELNAAVTGPTGSVALAWSAVSGATGYNVYRGTSTGAETVLVGTTTAVSFTDTGAAPTTQSPPTVNGAYKWTYDATGGARHSLTESWLSPALHVLMWSGARPDLTLDLGASFTLKILTDYRSFEVLANGYNENFWAFTGESLAHILLASGKWPGLPAAT